MMISPVETHGKLDFPKEQENTFLKGKLQVVPELGCESGYMVRKLGVAGMTDIHNL